MFRVCVAILAAAFTAAIVAFATGPVAAVGTVGSRPAAKGDRLDAGQRARCLNQQAGVSSSQRQCRRDGAGPTRHHAEVRIAWNDIQLMKRLSG